LAERELETGFREPHVEHLIGPDSMAMGVKEHPTKGLRHNPQIIARHRA
jgi:hypothetical protein